MALALGIVMAVGCAPAPIPPQQGRGPSTPVAPGASTVAGAADPTPVLAASPRGDLPSWSSVDAPQVVAGGAPFGGPGNQYVESVAAYGDGFVAVGYDIQIADDAVEGRVWVSPDGMGWTTAPDPDGTFTGRRLALVGVSGQRLVVLGQADDAEVTRSVWLSDDGVAWRRSVAADEAFVDTVIFGLEAGSNGFVAWGAGQAGEQVLLASRDGESWARSAFATDFPGAEVVDVAAFGNAWVAVGGTRVPADQRGFVPGDGRAWTSTDGLVWDGVVVDGFELRHVVAGADGLLALGQATTCVRCISEPALWQSADGRSWAPAGEGALSQAYAGDGGRIVRLDAYGSMALAWSPDGLQWTQLAAAPAPLDLNGPLAVGSNGIVAFAHPNGTSEVTDQVDAAAWYFPAH